MKTIFAILTFTTLISSAFASDIIFKSDSPVPPELQDRIVKAIQFQCKNININNLTEVKSAERVEVIDQGIRDFYYSTVLSYSYYFDGTHPITYSFLVESSNIEVNNPPDPRYSVDKIEGLESIFCE